MSVSGQSAAYGIHLMLRARAVERVDVLDNPGLLEEFLGSLVDQLGMRVLDGPRVATEHGDRSRYGHSGVVILSESHAAIHGYPGRAELFLDVFTCRTFDANVVLTLCRKYFGDLTITELTLLERGLHWNPPAGDRLADWMASREADHSAGPADHSAGPADHSKGIHR